MSTGADAAEPDFSSLDVRLSFDENIELVRARALGDVLARANDLRAGYNALRAGEILCTRDQYFEVLLDARLPARVRSALENLMTLDELDWNDPKTVGGVGRRRFLETVEAGEMVLLAATEFCWFQPPADSGRVREQALAVARQHASGLVLLLRAFTAPTHEAAQQLATDAAPLLSNWDSLDELFDLIDTTDWWDTADSSDRIGLSLGVSGQFTDEYGIPDDAALFAAFRDEAEPLKAFAQAGARHLRPLLATAPSQVDEGALALPLAARQLASLDRPLHGFRVARRVASLAGEAWHKSASETQAVLDWGLDEGWRLQVAQRAVRRELMLLGRDDELREGDLASSMMRGYAGLAETGYRIYGTLVLQLRAIVRDGQRDAQLAGAPMLNALRERLAKDGSPAAKLIHESIDPGLRNLDAHWSWYWDENSAELVGVNDSGAEVFRAGLEVVYDQLELLTGCVSGLDAGIACFQVDQGLEERAADWLVEGRAPEARANIASIVLAGFGVPVAELVVSNRVLTVRLGEASPAESQMWGACVALLGGMFRDVDKLQVVDQNGGTILTLNQAACDAQLREKASSDLAVFHVLFDANCNAGHVRSDVLSDCLVLMLHNIEQVDVGPVVGCFDAGDFTPLGTLEGRLGWVAAFCAAARSDWTPAIRDCLRHVARCRRALVRAQSNDRDAFIEAADELVATQEFTEPWKQRHGSPPALLERLQAPFRAR